MPRSTITWLWIATACVLGSSTASGHASGEGASAADDPMSAPATWKGNDVTVTERLGARVPLDVRFRTQDGQVTTLGDALRGDLPTILTFNYSDCPMLCSLQLNGLTAALPTVAAPTPNEIALRAGVQFRIVTISLEPKDTLERLVKMRERYVEKLPEAQRAAARRGWTFLAAETPGDAAAIRRVADAVGFSYVYIADRAEWAHPAALIFLSTTGEVTRYVYGIEFAAATLRESIVKAGLAERMTAVGFMNRCYHYDPDANNHSRAGVMALRIGAAGFVVLLLAGLGTLHLVRRTRRPSSGRES